MSATRVEIIKKYCVLKYQMLDFAKKRRGRKIIGGGGVWRQRTSLMLV